MNESFKVGDKLVKRRKQHGMRNFILFVLICVVVAVSGKVVVNRLFPVDYTRYINQSAAEYGLDRYLVMGIIKAESNFNPRAISGSNAKGLMQLTDATAAECSRKMGIKNFQPDDIFDPKTNIRMGCFYLSYLLERFDGEEETALAAYNAGEGNVQKWLQDSRYSQDGKTLSKIPFAETENYNQKIRVYRSIYERMDQKK